MTTPTQTEYGPEIVVDGVRPSWLKDDERLRIIWDCNGVQTEEVKVSLFPERYWLNQIRSFRLPASHAYYTLAAHNAKHGTRFKYWPGGDEAPGDWDGDEFGVFYRDGPAPGRVAKNWKHWNHVWDIIGYTPKPCATQRHTDDPDPMSEKVREMLGLDDPQPDFVPCERTVLAGVKAIFEAPHPDGSDPILIAVAALESLLPKKDRAEELVDGWADMTQAPNIYASCLAYTRHLIAQGEIRG